jgi:hypothetical protein
VVIGGINWQTAFARQVVLQNTRQGPVGVGFQQSLGALQCGLDTCACDA